ncbi:IS481 family transposase, partial [Streptococcus respiraculi]
FYQHLRFYSYDDLIRQMKRYLYTSNRLPMQSLGWKSPIETRKYLQGASSLEIE